MRQARKGSIVLIKPMKTNKAYDGKRANEYMTKHRFKITKITEVIEPDEIDPIETYHMKCDTGIDGDWFWSRKMFWLLKG